MRAAALVAAVAAGCASGPRSGPAPEPEEWDRELPAEVRLENGEDVEATRYLSRVLDETTGLPVAGARITWYDESATPMPGIWVPENVVLSDRDGWAKMEAPAPCPWAYVEKEGYGPLGLMHRQDEYRLRPGVDFPLVLRDWLDRPVPGAVVEYILGCGHAPDVRTEITDAQGRAVLRCIDPSEGDLWIRAHGMAGRNPGYNTDPEGLERGPDGVAVIRCDPAPVVDGVILDVGGKPAAGLSVGTREAHRGPWTRTDAAGRFALLGALPYETLEVMAPAAEVGEPEYLDSFRSVPGVAVRLRLPPTGARDGAPAAILRVRAEAAGGVAPALGTERVVVVREEDGDAWGRIAEWKDGALETEFEVAPGRWEARVGRRGGQFRPEGAVVEVGPGGAEAFLRLHEAPRWKPVVLKDNAPVPWPWPATLRIAVEEGVADAVPVPGEEGAFYVPATGPFAAILEYDDGTSSRVRLDKPPADAGPTLTLPRPFPGWPGDPPREGLLPEETLAVLLPDGRPAPDARYEIHAPDVGRRYAGWLGEDGRARASLRRGDRLVFRTGDEDLAPLRAAIDGPGPWTFRWPAGAVEVRARDPAGAPLADFKVFFEGEDLDAGEEGVVTLRGLAAGPVRFWVDGEDLRGHDVRLLLKEREQRTVWVTLRAR